MENGGCKQECQKKVSPKTVQAFSQFFRRPGNGNILDARRPFSQKRLLEHKNANIVKRRITSAFKRVNSSDVKTVLVKAQVRRRGKWERWMEVSHAYVCSETERLLKLGVKFNHLTMRTLTLTIFAQISCSNLCSPQMIYPGLLKYGRNWFLSYSSKFILKILPYSGSNPSPAPSRHATSPSVCEECAVVARPLFCARVYTAHDL